MITGIESKKKKIMKIAYCILCLLVCTVLLTVDVIRCYNKYLSGEYQLEAEATISVDYVYLMDSFHGREYIHLGSLVGTEVYMYNIHEDKCDVRRKDAGYVYADNVSLEDLSYNSEDYELLSGEKRLDFSEYMQRIFHYTPEQKRNGFPSGYLEIKIPPFSRAFAALLVFDFVYVIYKAASKKMNFFGHIMNGIMYVSSTFCLLISVLGIYFG
jgi:hypothetical protein